MYVREILTNKGPQQSEDEADDHMVEVSVVTRNGRSHKIVAGTTWETTFRKAGRWLDELTACEMEGRGGDGQ